MPCTFDNTEIAFSGRSDADLRRAKLLFSLLSKPWGVELGSFLAQIGLKMHLPVQPLIKNTIFRQFVGGETISDCEQTIRFLATHRIGTILDYSVEGQETEADFENGKTEILKTVERAENSPEIPFVVFKVTGLAAQHLLEKVSEGKKLSPEEDAGWERVRHRVRTICKEAVSRNIPVFIDAEETWIQPAIDLLAEEMMSWLNKEKPMIFNTVQMYRQDRLDYIHRLHQKAENEGFYIGLKIVRGAYMEKERERARKLGYPSPIHPDKAGTDKAFNDAIQYGLKHLDKMAICISTHNEHSCQLACNIMEENGIDPNHHNVSFAQLLGMSDHISFNLAGAGYSVAKYVPYGPVKDVLPYLTRRARENTSVAGQTGRELSLISQELKRRKSQKSK